MSTPETVAQETRTILTCLGAVAWMLSEEDVENARKSLDTLRLLSKNAKVVAAIDGLQKIADGTVPYEVGLVALPLRERIMGAMVGGIAAFATYSRHLCAIVNEREKKQFATAVLEQVKAGTTTMTEAYEKLGQYRGMDIAEPSAAIGCAEMLQSQDNEVWTISGLIPAGSLVIVAGDAGCGKSFMVLDMCLKHAACDGYTPIRWLDEFATYGGAAVYFDMENARYLTSCRLRALSATGKEKLSFMTRQSLDLPMFDIANHRTFDKVRRQLDMMKLTPQDIVVFDTIRACYSGDENSSEDVQRAIGAITSCCPATKIVIHHLNKGEGSIIRRLRGSTAFSGAADLILGVTTTGLGDAKVSTIEAGKTRGSADVGEIVVNWMNRGDKLTFSARTHYELTENRADKVLAMMVEAGRRMTFSDIAALSKGFSGDAVADALKSLRHDGRVKQEIVNNKAYYAVSQPKETQ